MKRCVFVLFFLFLNVGIVHTQECLYKNYFYWAGRATVDYSESNFEDARKHFKNAFNKTDFPLSSDLYLALETAIQTKDTSWANTISIQLAKGGIPKQYFDKFQGFSWYESFENEYSVYQKFYKKNFNLEMREKLLELRYKDSLFNANYHKFRKGEIVMTLEELIEGASEVTNGFKSFVKKYGFPCEQKMGYYFKEGKIQPFPVVVLLIHAYQRGVLIYLDRLDYIVCDGKLRPVDQALINGFRGFGNSTGIEQEMKIRFEKYKPKD